MKKGRFDIRNISHLEPPFNNARPITDAFYKVFSEYPSRKLMIQGNEEFEKTLKGIAGMEEVKYAQEVMDYEISSGEENLSLLANIIFPRLELPKRKGGEPKVYLKVYREISAWCNGCDRSDAVATGLFDRKNSLDDFIPEQTLYANNLIGIYPQGDLTCDVCGSQNFRYQKNANTFVYRDEVEDKNRDLGRRVKEIIQKVSATVPYDKGNRSELYAKVETDILRDFYHMFKSVRKDDKPDGSPQYPKLYKLFEWIRRGNHDIEQFQWISQRTRKSLKDEIFANVSLPYAVIRTRIKQKETLFLKSLMVLYNLKYNVDDKKEKEESKFVDLYGIRMILPEERDCFRLAEKLETVPGFKIEKFEDMIRHPRRSGYRALHLDLNSGGIIYEVQIKTHEMDRSAETDSKQKHDVAYLEEKIKLIKENVPPRIMDAVSIVIGCDCKKLLLAN
ncbi:hypothetical protein J4480_02370 [Candidatus Woesearchaeota archaeon]|nr:hypothetical protein [Candidatus Woesearchaeota archaeon]